MSNLSSAPPQDELFETANHHFVVELRWVARREPGQPDIWHGRITHIPSGECRYFQHIDAITAFIAPYLQEPGAA